MSVIHQLRSIADHFYHRLADQAALCGLVDRQRKVQKALTGLAEEIRKSQQRSLMRSTTRPVPQKETGLNAPRSFAVR
jgi:hypothetical protein